MISCRNAFFRFIIFGYLDQSLRNVMTMGAAVVDPVMLHHPCAGVACDGPGTIQTPFPSGPSIHHFWSPLFQYMYDSFCECANQILLSQLKLVHISLVFHDCASHTLVKPEGMNSALLGR